MMEAIRSTSAAFFPSIITIITWRRSPWPRELFLVGTSTASPRRRMGAGPVVRLEVWACNHDGRHADWPPCRVPGGALSATPPLKEGARRPVRDAQRAGQVPMRIGCTRDRGPVQHDGPHDPPPGPSPAGHDDLLSHQLQRHRDPGTWQGVDADEQHVGGRQVPRPHAPDEGCCDRGRIVSARVSEALLQPLSAVTVRRAGASLASR